MLREEEGDLPSEQGADAPPRGKTSEKMTKLFINGQKTIP